MNQFELEDHNRSRMDAKRGKSIDKMLEPEPATRDGFYQGYEASTGKHLVKTVDGSIIRGKLISNAAIAVGAKVQVTVPSSGTPIIKSNPL